MNKNKNSKIMLVLSILLMFLVIGAVSAADETSNETVSTTTNNGVDTLNTDGASVDDGVSAADTNNIIGSDTSNHDSKTQSTNNDLLNTEDKVNWTVLEKELKNGGTVILNHKYYQYNDGDNSSLNITNMIIDGNGATIDGSYQARYFISDGNLTLKNIKFINYSSSGSCSIIYFSKNCNNVTITNCNFSNTNYRMLCFAGYNNDVTITHCSFNNVVGPAWGSAMLFDGLTDKIKIEECDFKNLTVINNGGGGVAFREAVNVTINKCNFTNTSGINNGQFSNGGAIYVYNGGAENVSITSCIFNGTYSYTGGAIASVTSTINLTIDNCIFINTYTTNYQGGALYLKGLKNSNIKNSFFINTTSKDNGGGAISTEKSSVDSVNITNCIFYNITAFKTHGGAIYFDGAASNVNISYCNFNNTSCQGSGGAINFHNPNSFNNSVSYCNFTNSTCGYNGGAIELYSRNTVIDHCNFINNTATGNSGSSPNAIGGAIVLYAAASDVNITNCYFKGNKALNGTAVTDLTQSAAGGAIGSALANCLNSKIMNCIFEENYAYQGGAIYYFSKNTTISGCSFMNNSAETNGGAVFANAENSLVSNCVFADNNASNGLNFYASTGNNIKFEKCGFTEVFVGSDDANGDGLRYDNPCNWNTAFDMVEIGGTVYVMGEIIPTMNYTIDKSIILKGYDSSSVYNLNSTTSVRPFTVTGDNVIVRDLTFKNSKLNENGSVFLWKGDYGNIINCIFTNNTAKNGVVYVSYETDSPDNRANVFIIDKCSFTYNNATSNGGGVYVLNTNNTMIYNSTFQHNCAELGGALAYGTDNQLMFYFIDKNTNSSFENNTATIESANDIYTPENIIACVEEVFIKINGDGNGLSPDKPTPDLRNAFSMVSPNGKVYFVDKGETWDLTEIFKSLNGMAHSSKFGVTFIGNDTTFLNITFVCDSAASSVSVYNFTFKDCKQAIIWNAANGLISNCKFINCGNDSSISSGAALTVNGENFVVKNSLFENNTLTAPDSKGGAIYVDAIKFKLDNCTFKNNTLSDGLGGHLYLTSNANNTVITGSRFINATGSAIVIDNVTDVSITDSSFVENKGVSGAGIYLINGTLTINGVKFTKNTAQQYGGGLYLRNGTVYSMESNQFLENTANYGGAVYSNIALNIKDSIFNGNSAVYDGGALYLNCSDNVVDNVSFTSNKAKRGAGIFTNADKLTFEDPITFTRNEASDTGVLFFDKDITVYNNENLVFDGNIVPANALVVSVSDGVKITTNVLYVSQDGQGTGFWSNECTNDINYALENVFANGGKIILNGEYVIDDVIRIIGKNIALVGNSSETIISNNNKKSLFNNT